tara:strand:+ start:945 stop:2315 length:1371 start_codon:yes stop_codon:yes gene_type:complete
MNSDPTMNMAMGDDRYMGQDGNMEMTPDKIRVAIVDIDGVLRGKYITSDKYESIKKNGMGFCSVIFSWDVNDECYDNVESTGLHTGYHDIIAKVDKKTETLIPWSNTLFYMMDFPNFEACPRNLLKNIVSKGRKMGYQANFGLEYEWFNFAETSNELHEKEFKNMKKMNHGNFGYSHLRLSQNGNYCNELMEKLAAVNIEIEGLHTETGPGAYEIALKYCETLKMADTAVFFKTIVKEVSNGYGITPTFMAKIDKDIAGCGCHIHQSLSEIESGKNIFFDGTEENNMSEVMKYFLAGQLYCLPYILPFFAPNINSYKRLVEGYWAPTRSSWGVENRTTTHRVVKARKNTRIECRVGGADLNPYLAIAASLASGLYGIRKKLELPKKIDGNAYKSELESLPKDLAGAVEKMKSKISLLNDLFGEKFVNHFIKTREWECKKYREHVTDWEKKRYLEII